VAIKENLDASPEAQRQFTREARILARLSHPNLPRVTDHFFIPGQGQYLVMDFVEGEDLQAMLARLGLLPELQVLTWVSQICDALAYLHSQPSPIIHRDIKPANIKIRPDGRAMLVDFGIAKVYDPQLVTTIGAKAVTPGYSPPEQYGGGSTDARSDIYALGATLYHLLTGQIPPESVQRMVSVATTPSPRQLNQQISPMVEQVILRAIEVTTERRFQSVDELRTALTQPLPGAVGQEATRPAAPDQTKLMPQRKPAVTPPRAKRPSRLSRVGLLGGIGLVVIVLVVGALAISGVFRGARPTSTPVVAVLTTDVPTQVSVGETPGTTAPVPPTSTPVPEPTATPTPGNGLHKEVSFGTEALITTATDAWSVYAADMDGDGDVDVLSASYDDDKIVWYENDGGSSPAFTGHVITTNADGAWSVYAADVDGDGDVDVLSASELDDKIAWYENSGGSPPAFTSHIIAITADQARSVYAVDVDGDGDVDVLSASITDNKIAWYENDGGSPPTFTDYVITTAAGRANSVYAADMDDDGDMDALSASSSDNKIVWYENNGGSPPAFTNHVITTTTAAARWVYAADVDGDGDVDVFSASYNDDKIAWYENDGGSPPAFTGHVITTNADCAESVYAADVDGDGDIDVLSASYMDAKVAWYENDGSSPPAFTDHVITTAAVGAVSVYAADMDGDGDLDVLSASSWDDKIAWYENRGR